MTSLLFGVLAAASLSAAGIGAPGETRSAQSLPNDHLVLPATDAASSGKFHNVHRLADGTPNFNWDHTDKAQCDMHHWHWYAKEARCHRNILPLYLAGSAAIGGILYVAAGGSGSGAVAGQASSGAVAGQPSISH